jgi:TolB protein
MPRTLGSIFAAPALASVGVGLLAAAACAQPAAAPTKPADPSPHGSARAPSVNLDWKILESPLLFNHRQLTQREHSPGGPGFLKAGEAYFDHHQPPKYIIFQAIVVPAEGVEPDPFYAMYAARLLRDDKTGEIRGLDEPVRISPEKSANTCGWFHPTIPWRVMYGSTMVAPADDTTPGFQVGSRKYVWMFPKEMDVVFRDLRPVHRELTDPMATTAPPVPAGFQGPVAKVFDRPNYDAECSWSKDGRFILYAHVRDEMTRGRPDADLWIYDTKTQKQHQIVSADGYDGGPFFSPDGKMICYRSDRRGDDLLQLFVAELKFDDEGVPVGITREIQITDDQHVNWAPYWHPSGKFIVYGSSGVAHSNYEVFAVEVDAAKSASELRKRRITFASGADVLPVFSDDGQYMMWTGQRGPMVSGETKPSSQLWIAQVKPGPAGFADPEHLFDNLPDQRPEGQPATAPAAQPTNK